MLQLCVYVVLFDSSKAFDVFNHAVLMQKSESVGVSFSLAVLSYCEEECASISWVYSSTSNVTSRVPQGSVLEPFLFLLYVNPLPSHIANNCKIFADDLHLYMNLYMPPPNSLWT